MKNKTTISKLLTIAEQNKTGFTVDRNLNPITKGYAVATKLTQNSFGVSGCAHALAIAFYQDAEKFDGVGGWLNTDNGQYYFDAVKIFRTEDKAREYALKNNQLSFFHLTTGTEIDTIKTGAIPNNVGFSHIHSL